MVKEFTAKEKEIMEQVRTWLLKVDAEWEETKRLDSLRRLDDEQRHREKMNMVWISLFTFVLAVLVGLLWKYSVVQSLLWHYRQNAGVPGVPAVPAASDAAFGEAVDVLFLDSDDAASDAASGETADGLF
jgi:hypothetical protein